MHKLSLLFAALLPWLPSSAPAAPAPGETRNASELLREGLFEEDANRDLDKAAAAYAGVVEWYDAQRKLAATAMFRLAEVRIQQGNKAEGTTLYQRVLAEFADQDPLAKLSRERLATLGTAAPATPPAVALPGKPDDEEGKAMARFLQRYPNGASPMTLDDSPDEAPYNGRKRMIYAAEQGWTRLLTLMLDDGARVDGYGRNGGPLRAAAEGGHRDAVALLLARGALIDRADPDGWTALHAACYGRYREIVSLLLDKGAKTEVFCGRLPDPKTIPVHPWGPDLPGWLSGWKEIPLGSPLLIAARNGDVDTLALLLDHHADPNFYSEEGANDKAPASPLLVALRLGQEGAARLLLERGANAKFITPHGLTILHAAAAGTPTLVPMLLDLGLPQTADANGWTPLFYSVYLGGTRHNLSEAKGEERTTPLPEFMSHLAAYETAWAALLAHGADINAPDHTGLRLIHYSAPDDYHPTEIPGWLIAHGADIDARDSEGRTTLLRFSNRYGVQGAEGMKGVSWLLENGADPAAKDSQGGQEISRWSGPNGQALKQKYVLPPLLAKSLGAHAVTILVDTQQSPLRPLRVDQQADFDLPPSLVLCMRLMPNGAVYQHLDVEVHHAAAVGKEASVDQLKVDLSAAVDASKWPGLRWGDVVVFRSDANGSTMNSEDTYGALAAGKQRGLTVQIGDELASLTLADPAADATAYWRLGRKIFDQEQADQPSPLGPHRLPVEDDDGDDNSPKDGSIGHEPKSLLAWTPVAKPLPAWTLSQLVLQLMQSRPDAQLGAIRLSRIVNGQTQEWPLDLRAANPAEAETDGTGQPTGVKKLDVSLADGDRLVIPRLPADDPAALEARRQIICFALPGSPFAQQVFARSKDGSAAHTLGELLMQAYLSPMVIPNPNLSKVVVRRLTGKGAEEQFIPVDVTQTILSAPPVSPDQSQGVILKTDLPLQWGDRVEIPAIEGIDPAKWNRLSAATLSYLSRVLTRQVKVTFNGQTLPDNDSYPSLEPEFIGYAPDTRMFPLRFTQASRAPAGAFTALTLLRQLRVNLDTMASFTLRMRGQSTDYNLQTLKTANPWIGFGSQVNIQQLSP